MLCGIQASAALDKDPDVRKHKEFCFALNKAYEEITGLSAYSSFVEFVHVSSQFDSRYGM